MSHIPAHFCKVINTEAYSLVASKHALLALCNKNAHVERKQKKQITIFTLFYYLSKFCKLSLHIKQTAL